MHANLSLHDDRVLIHTEENIQKAQYQICKITDAFNMKSSDQKNKVMAFHGRTPVRPKVTLECRTFHKANKFYFLKAPYPRGICRFEIECMRFCLITSTVL
jgi:hypothetical protein